MAYGYYAKKRENAYKNIDYFLSPSCQIQTHKSKEEYERIAKLDQLSEAVYSNIKTVVRCQSKKIHNNTLKKHLLKIIGLIIISVLVFLLYYKFPVVTEIIGAIFLCSLYYELITICSGITEPYIYTKIVMSGIKSGNISLEYGSIDDIEYIIKRINSYVKYVGCDYIIGDDYFVSKTNYMTLTELRDISSVYVIRLKEGEKYRISMWAKEKNHIVFDRECDGSMLLQEIYYLSSFFPYATVKTDSIITTEAQLEEFKKLAKINYLKHVDPLSDD